MTPSDYFSAGALGYRAFRPGYPEELLDALASLSDGHDLAWDAGCGSGQLSALLPRHYARVIATDLSAAQLEQAADHPAVEYRVGLAEASGLPDASVDLAVAAQAAHWFDLDAYYAEVRRVARRGAAVALLAYGRARLEPGLDEVFEHFHRGVLADYWPPERREVDAGYATLPFPFAESTLPALEYEATWLLDRLLGYVSTWSATQQLLAAGGEEEFERFAAALGALWGDPESARPVRFPIRMRAGRVAVASPA